jgi:hypothetical protein
MTGKQQAVNILYCGIVILFPIRLSNHSTDIFHVITTENNDFEKIITNQYIAYI